jgi:flagellar basal-body rod protein FlgB
MNWMETPMLQRLEKYLDLVAFRQELVSSNLANIDTPGYRTRDIDFAGELRRAEMQLSDGSPNPRVQQVGGLIERPDGNNVNLERESLALARTQLQFRAGVQLVRAEIRRLQTAINEGR